MTIIILERVPASVRGELTRWMLELQAGVFIGSMSASVRDVLWKMIASTARHGAAILIHSAANEQGFAVRFLGKTSRAIESFDGLLLLRVR